MQQIQRTSFKCGEHQFVNIIADIYIGQQEYHKINVCVIIFHILCKIVPLNINKSIDCSMGDQIILFEGNSNWKLKIQYSIRPKTNL